MLSSRGFRRSAAFVVVFLAAGKAAFAYIDPGTGMSFISGVGAFVAAIFAVVAGAVAVTFRRWRSFLASLFKKEPGEDRHSR